MVLSTSIVYTKVVKLFGLFTVFCRSLFLTLEYSFLFVYLPFINQKQDSVNHSIHFVSLGPGEPELITVKGLRLLQQADVIYCPATPVAEGKVNSRAAEIVKVLGIDPSKITLFYLPMSRDRAAALQSYDQLFADVCRDYSQERNVVVVAEGDAGFYSSIQYVYDKLAESGVAVERTAGIPAFIAAGALAGMHIVKQEERLMVVPGLISADELAEKLADGYVVVIMKLCACQAAVQTCMQQHPSFAYHYFENVGTAREYYSTDTAVLQQKKFPYFSLMIIHP